MLNVTLNKDNKLDYETAAAMEAEYYAMRGFTIYFSADSFIEAEVADDEIYCIRVVIERVCLTPLEIERPHTNGEMVIVWERPEDPAYFAIGDFIFDVDVSGVSWDDHVKRFGE